MLGSRITEHFFTYFGVFYFQLASKLDAVELSKLSPIFGRNRPVVTSQNFTYNKSTNFLNFYTPNDKLMPEKAPKVSQHYVVFFMSYSEKSPGANNAPFLSQPVAG